MLGGPGGWGAEGVISFHFSAYSWCCHLMDTHCPVFLTHISTCLKRLKLIIFKQKNQNCCWLWVIKKKKFFVRRLSTCQRSTDWNMIPSTLKATFMAPFHNVSHKAGIITVSVEMVARWRDLWRRDVLMDRQIWLVEPWTPGGRRDGGVVCFCDQKVKIHSTSFCAFSLNCKDTSVSMWANT